MSLRLSMAVQLLHRPHLITPAAAEDFARRIRGLDPRAFERRPGPFAFLRRKGLVPARPGAWDDDSEGGAAVQLRRPEAYAPLWAGEPDHELAFGVTVKDRIALMEVRGPLVERGEWLCGEFYHGYDTIGAAIDFFDASSHADALMIRFDTPGGVVASGLDDVAGALSARGADAKPVWAFCEMACSAGYWLAAQCDRVIAPKAGLVGSIGAVMVHESGAGMLEKEGIKVEAIQFGAHKTDGAWWKELSEAARADLQAMIDQIGESFLTAVEIGRAGKMTREDARATEARVFGAEHADASRSGLALGLVDDIMSERATFEALKAEVSGARAPFPIRPAAASAGSTPAARAAQPPETDMKLDVTNTSALARAMAANPKLAARLQAAVDAFPAASAEGDLPDGDEDEEDEADAAAAADEEEGEGEAAGAEENKPDAATVLAILDLPEAEGRQQQARVLAATPGMTVAAAKGILAAAPKASRLAERMKGHDPKLAAGGAADTRSEAQKIAQRALAAAGLLRKQ